MPKLLRFHQHFSLDLIYVFPQLNYMLPEINFFLFKVIQKFLTNWCFVVQYFNHSFFNTLPLVSLNFLFMYSKNFGNFSIFSHIFRCGVDNPCANISVKKHNTASYTYRNLPSSGPIIPLALTFQENMELYHASSCKCLLH